MAAFLTGLVAGARRVLARAGEERVALAAVWAGFLAYAFAAGIDWMWELTVVSVVGIALLGLLTSGATAADAPARRLRARWDIAARVALAVAGVFVILAVGVSLLTNREIQASQNDVRARRPCRRVQARRQRAQDRAVGGEPVPAARAGRGGGRRIRRCRALDTEGDRRAPDDWRAWFLLTRFRTESGQITAALLTLKHTRELNPRSELLARVKLGR